MATAVTFPEVDTTLVEKPQAKKGVQLAGFAAGIASVSWLLPAMHASPVLILRITAALGMDKGGQ